MSLCKSSCVSVYALCLWFCHQTPQKRLSVFFTISLQKPLFCWGSSEAFFPQAEQPQLPQPFLMWEILLSINHFNGSVLESLLWLPAPLVLGSTELDPTHWCVLSVLSRAVGSTPLLTQPMVPLAVSVARAYFWLTFNSVSLKKLKSALLKPRVVVLYFDLPPPFSIQNSTVSWALLTRLPSALIYPTSPSFLKAWKLTEHLFLLLLCQLDQQVTHLYTSLSNYMLH